MTPITKHGLTKTVAVRPATATATATAMLQMVEATGMATPPMLATTVPTRVATGTRG
jgi:hypothetical protein